MESDVRSYVKVKKDKDTKQLQKASDIWTRAAFENKITYEIDWLGVPIIQLPEDMIMMQELIWRTKPDYIVECGIAHGGSLIFYASLLELIGNGIVIGIDIDIRKHNRESIENHPLYHRIRLIEGDSTADIHLHLQSKKVIVILDSDHHKHHVLKEINKYKDLIGIGYYIVVNDTSVTNAVKWGINDESYDNNGPKEAIEMFLAHNNEFEIDKYYNKLYVSQNTDGYLKRIK